MSPNKDIINVKSAAENVEKFPSLVWKLERNPDWSLSVSTDGRNPFPHPNVFHNHAEAKRALTCIQLAHVLAPEADTAKRDLIYCLLQSL